MWRRMREAQLELEDVMRRNGMTFTPLVEIEATRERLKRMTTTTAVKPTEETP